ncbi:DUF6019 family protein [Alkalibacter mobilis]|nr:DUF6019 family protein [Alkalibacter mobilis]
MSLFAWFGVLIYPILMILPIIVLYFVIKMAVKNAIKESRLEDRNI